MNRRRLAQLVQGIKWVAVAMVVTPLGSISVFGGIAIYAYFFGG